MKPLRANCLSLNYKEIKEEAARVLEELPGEFRERLHNVEIVVEKRPKKSQLLSLGLDPRHDTLYGLYQGTPLPDRSTFDPPILPDVISIYAEPLTEDFPEPAELRRQIRITVLHEIAHYFGMDDDEIDKLGY